MGPSASTQQLIAICAFVYFAAYALVQLVVSAKGRRACSRFAAALPQEYAEHGHPLPTLWDRTRAVAYNRFLLHKKYGELSDHALAEQFSRLRPWELSLFVFLGGGFVAVGLAFAWNYWFSV